MQKDHSSYSNLTADNFVELARRWGVAPTTVLRWNLDNVDQLRLLLVGRHARDGSASAQPISNLSLFAQEHGCYIKDVIRLSGLTRQTLNRLNRKSQSRCRLRDLIAGTEATLAAVAKGTASQTDSRKRV